MKVKIITKSFIFLFVIFVISANAEEYSGGAVIVPITEDFNQSTFNIKTDAASLYIEKAILYKNNGWFTTDKDVAIVAKITINSQNRARITQSLTISKIYKFDISLYDDGRIEIPLKSLPLLDTFKLSGDDYIVTSMVLDLYLCKRKEKSTFSKTLETLIEVSKKIPIPSNPYVQYATIFGDTFSQVIDEAVKEGADTIPFARFGLRFLQGQAAINFTEKPGVHAVILGSDSKEDGVLQIDQLQGKKLSFDNVLGLKADGKKVKNNYIVVRVISSMDPFLSLIEKDTTINRINKEADSALKISDNAGLKSNNLKKFIKIRETKGLNELQKIDGSEIEKVINELNTIKSINTIKDK